MPVSRMLVWTSAHVSLVVPECKIVDMPSVRTQIQCDSPRCLWLSTKKGGRFATSCKVRKRKVESHWYVGPMFEKKDSRVELTSGTKKTIKNFEDVEI